MENSEKNEQIKEINYLIRHAQKSTSQIDESIEKNGFRYAFEWGYHTEIYKNEIDILILEEAKQFINSVGLQKYIEHLTKSLLNNPTIESGSNQMSNISYAIRTEQKRKMIHALTQIFESNKQ